MADALGGQTTVRGASTASDIAMMVSNRDSSRDSQPGPRLAERIDSRVGHLRVAEVEHGKIFECLEVHEPFIGDVRVGQIKYGEPGQPADVLERSVGNAGMT